MPTPAVPAKILVVDDEPSIADSVATVLHYEGYEVAVTHLGQRALEMARERSFDLIVLDVMLPDIDGMEVTRRIRLGGIDVPILFLTAKSTVADRVAGLSVGGDDYVSKPFSLVEIAARVRAILRRRQLPLEDSRLKFSDLVMDEESHEVWRGDQAVRLTATEFNIVRLFLLNPRRVLSKDQIMDHVWNYSFGGNPSIVETYIGYVRKKINALGPPLIHTIRLVGYVLREDS
ncbi:MAG: two component transcriptional regulator, winged helix family [Acidimicrobiaceae bacterium]|nr:two component transcriptional regulator, winged helix family [Acidimicrobiaceae bacterium]